MNKPFKNTWEIYTSSFEKIFLLMLTTTLPLLILHFITTNYIYKVTPTTSVFSIADIYYAYITILLFLFAQVPYIRYVYNEYMGIEKNLRDTFYQFIIQGFTIFLFGAISAFLAIIGFSLFILPGFLLLALIIPIPYISIFDEKPVRKSIKEGLRIGRKNYFKLLIIILITGFLEVLVGAIIMNQIFNITNSFGAQLITQIILNLIYFPFIVMLLASFIIKWREEQEVLEFSKEEITLN